MSAKTWLVGMACAPSESIKVLKVPKVLKVLKVPKVSKVLKVLKVLQAKEKIISPLSLLNYTQNQ